MVPDCSTIISALSISIAAMLGVLTRMWINSLFGPEGVNISASDSIVFYDLAANVLGCFVMGFHGSWKMAVKWSPATNLAISTGYAGSVTST